ncbi:MAG TPA: DUF2314 domain-containing protein [Longimicrobium sp.]|jgi:uncharacterized protein YegJ (DUF2314 family)
MRLHFLALAAVAACGGPASDDPNVRMVAASDPAMLAAIDSARATIGELLSRIASPPATQTHLSVKVPLREGDDVEHMWLDSPRYDGRLLHGTLDNQPVVVHNVRPGDAVSVAPNEISDWMAIDAGRLCGGYTIRAMQDRLTAEQRAQFESSLGIVSLNSPC